MDKATVLLALRLVKPKRIREYLDELDLSTKLMVLASDPANFINICAGGQKTLTNGAQVKGGSCNGIRKHARERVIDLS